MSVEDKRAAVGISVTLSGQLIAAALAMLAVEGAFVAYALGNRNVSEAFFWVAGLTAFCFILSIFIAGKGVTKARNAGFVGTWNLGEGKAHFNWQAILCALGLGAFAVTLLLSGGPQDSKIETKLGKLEQRISKIESSLQTMSSKEASFKIRLDSSKARLDQMENDLNLHINNRKIHSTE